MFRRTDYHVLGIGSCVLGIVVGCAQVLNAPKTPSDSVLPDTRAVVSDFVDGVVVCDGGRCTVSLSPSPTQQVYGVAARSALVRFPAASEPREVLLRDQNSGFGEFQVGDCMSRESISSRVMEGQVVAMDMERFRAGKVPYYVKPVRSPLLPDGCEVAISVSVDDLVSVLPEGQDCEVVGFGLDVVVDASSDGHYLDGLVVRPLVLEFKDAGRVVIRGRSR